MSETQARYDALPYGFRDTFAAFLEYELSTRTKEDARALWRLATHGGGLLAGTMQTVADEELHVRRQAEKRARVARWQRSVEPLTAEDWGERTELLLDHALASLSRLNAAAEPLTAAA